MDPKRLERFADQPLIHSRALASGTVTPASRYQKSITTKTLRNKGVRWEKYDEDAKRVVPLEPHPDVYDLLGAREAGSKAAHGVPPVTHAHLLQGALAHPWAAAKFKDEFWNWQTRGPSLEVLSLDPGPMYALMPVAPGTIASAADRPAPSLLSVTQYVADAAAAQQAAAAADGGGSAFAATAGAGGAGGAGLGSTLSASFASSAAGGAGGVAAGGFRAGSTALVRSGTLNMLSTGAASAAADLSSSVGAQWAGPGIGGTVHTSGGAAVPLDTLLVGPTNALVTPGAAAAASATVSGAALDAAASTRGYFGLTRVGSGATLADAHASGGVAVDATVELAAQAGMPLTVATVIHPLDAYHTTRRLVADEKAGQVEAERFRKRVLTAAVRRSYLTAMHHPHGALGVGSMEEELVPEYAQVAALRRAEAEARMHHAAAREAALLRHNTSEGRRGYSILRHDLPPASAASAGALAGPASARLSDTAVLAQGSKEAAVDGVKFLDHKARSAAAAGPAHVVDTKRAVLGDRGDAVPAWRTQRIINESTAGKAYNIVTGRALPNYLTPSIPERVPETKNKQL